MIQWIPMVPMDPMIPMATAQSATAQSIDHIAGQLKKKPLRWTFRGWVCCILR